MENASPVKTHEEKYINVFEDISMSVSDDDNYSDADRLFSHLAASWFELNGERILLEAISNGMKEKQKPKLKRQNAELNLKKTSKKIRKC